MVGTWVSEGPLPALDGGGGGVDDSRMLAKVRGCLSSKKWAQYVW